MITGKVLSKNDGAVLSNPTMYRSAIGALQYLCHTRPDIAFAVNKLSQFLQCPTTSHWSGVKRVLRYLKGTLHYGLHLGYCERLVLVGYSDADWACCPDDRRSIAGYCIYFGDSLVSWSSKKQAVVSRSSTESEYRALAHVASEITWIESLLKEFCFQLPGKPITWCDNISASALTSNPVYHARTKHIEINIHFVRDKVLKKELEIRYVPTSDQIADCLTKSISHSRFQVLVDKLGVRMSPLRLRDGVKNLTNT
ncbi:secreted RxLR effector protein 161-like [Humulus lupulus]|uniref:secreted RxLR effector protein 161-like n=1 Tax=Humulus lupulus TaxID=3486 RepID=UPI002B417B6F|nr:secreted RxLR effector protein 161-like [Humulus lupulus]